MSEDADNLLALKGFDDFESILGDELRGERATLGKSLLDVQRDLRIKAAYISAIENCDPTVFPNQGFVAGYVRSYARYLKLDPDELFARFCAESGFEGVNAGMVPAKKKTKRKKHDVPKDLKGAEVKPRFTDYSALHNDSLLSVVSPSGIASVLVLGCLISVLSYGGWAILKDIQRVEFSPVEQTPEVEASIATPGDQISASQRSSDLAGVAAETIEEQDDLLGRLYRPQELSIPKMEPRDGPMASIDPDTVGVLKPQILPSPIETVSVASPITAENPNIEREFPIGPVVTVENKNPSVEIFASRAAWVRVHLADGTVLFEKILEKGEIYAVPEDIENPLLRAGNSGSVYVLLDKVAYGPVGAGTAVAKQVSLSSVEVSDTFELASDIDLGPEIGPTLNAASNE